MLTWHPRNKIYNIQWRIDTSTVFSTFDLDQLDKIHQHGWKECLKISNAAKFESDLLKTIEDIALEKCFSDQIAKQLIIDFRMTFYWLIEFIW